MWWKIYFWVLLIVSLIGLPFILSDSQTWSLRDIAVFIGDVLGFIGLYSFIYKKDILPQVFWKYFFWIWIVADSAIAIIYNYTALQTNELLSILYRVNLSETSDSMFVFGTLIALPLIYALYRLAYPTTAVSRKALSSKKTVVKKKKK